MSVALLDRFTHHCETIETDYEILLFGNRPLADRSVCPRDRRHKPSAIICLLKCYVRLYLRMRINKKCAWKPNAGSTNIEATIMKKITATAVGASILVLAGCGGGSPMVSSAMDRDEGDPGSAQIGDLIPPSETTLSAASRAATARAKFGSVTQSSNVASGTTTDSASASFDGNQPTFRVTRSGGSEENFRPPSDSSTDTDSSDDDADAWTLRGQESGNSISIAFVEANWNQQAAQSEWFARGVWIKTGDADNPSPQNIEIGAFVDGPEIESDAALGGLTGSATYTGLVSGIYVSTDDELDVGRFNSILNMEANFTSNTISGCVGCNNNGIQYEEGFDDDESSSGRVPYRLRLGQATINDNGRIEGGDVTAETDLDVPISTTGGSWSGRFSNRNVNGRPQAVAGTLGSSFTTGTGNGAETIVFVGSFLSPPGEWGQ